MRNASGTPIGTFPRSEAPIAGGGFVCSFDQAADGSILVHCPDVTGTLIRNYPADTKWRWMLTPSTLPAGEFDPLASGLNAGDGAPLGVVGTRIAPSNKNICYTFFNSKVLKSVNLATTATFTATSLGQFYSPSNSGSQRNSNRMIDIHPTNPDIAIFGTTHYATDTTKSGAFYTTDGGATAAVKITGMSNATNRGAYPDRYLVVIDPGDATVGYVHVGGIGLYPLTITAGGVMTAGALIAGSPVRCSHLIVTAAGVVYCAAGGANGGITANDLYSRTRAGVATSFTTGCPTGAISVTVDPSNAARIVTADQDGEIRVTYNSGTNWERFVYFDNNYSKGAGEIAWLSNVGFTIGSRLFPAMLKFDTTVANKMWVAHGLGISSCTVPTTTGGALVFNDYSLGNEEKVAEACLSIPGNSVPMLFNWDYFVCRMKDLRRPNNSPVGTPGGLSIGKDADYAIDDPNFIAVAVAQRTASNMTSADGGKTFGLLPNQGSFGYGCGAVAVGNKANILLCGTDNAISLYTKTGGSTWNPIQLVAGTNITNLSNAQTLRRKIVSADKTRPGVFALIVPGITSASVVRTDAGLWVTEDGGDNWTKKISGIIGSSIPGFTGDTRQYYREKVAYIPGFSGEMLHTCHADLGPDWLHHITGDGTSIVRLGGGVGVTDVDDFSFGPVLTGQTRPSVVFHGKVGGVKGLYFTHNWFATTPTLIASYPLDNLADIGCVSCDRNIFGRVFVGGIGWNYFDLTDTMSVT